MYRGLLDNLQKKWQHLLKSINVLYKKMKKKQLKINNV